MKENLNELRDSLKRVQGEICRQGEVTPRNKRDMKALDELAESLQDEAQPDDWLSLFDFRNEISEWMESELALFV